MHPPTAHQPPGIPAAWLNDPETAEEVREALAIARAEARALHADLVRLSGERTRLATALTEVVSTIEEYPTADPARGDAEPALLALVAERLRLLRQTLLEPPVLGDAA